MLMFYHYHFINLNAHVLSFDPSVLIFSKANMLCWSERGARNASVYCSQPSPAWAARWWNRSEPLITSEQRNAALSFLQTADTKQSQHTQLMTKSPARWIKWGPWGQGLIFAFCCRPLIWMKSELFYLLSEANRVLSSITFSPATGSSCRHPESSSLERFLTKFCFLLMNSSKRTTELGSFLGQCVGNRFSLIHMSALIRDDAPLLPWLLHTSRLLWHSLISLDLDGSVAENAAPKLPLTADNRPPPSRLSVPSCPPPPLTTTTIRLSCALSPHLSPPRVFLSPLPPLITFFFSFIFHFWIMSRAHPDVPLDQQRAPLTLITLLTVTGR